MSAVDEKRRTSMHRARAKRETAEERERRIARERVNHARAVVAFNRWLKQSSGSAQ